MFHLFKKTTGRTVPESLSRSSAAPETATPAAGDDVQPVPPAAVSGGGGAAMERDRRLFLKIKLKSLAAEARIIRREESRVPPRQRGPRGLHSQLHLHRTGNVRSEARHTLLAYGFLRGVPRHRIEAAPAVSPDWPRVEAMVRKYGLPGSPRTPDDPECARLLDRLRHWRNAPADPAQC